MSHGVVLGLSPGSRAIGSAVVADGRTVLLRCARLRPERGFTDEESRLVAWTEALIATFQPGTVVIVDAGVETSAGRALTDLVRRTVTGRTCLELTLRDLAAETALPPSRPVLSRHIAALDPLVGASTKPRRAGPRSERERYWEPAALAALAGRLVHHGIALEEPPCPQAIHTKTGEERGL